MWLLGTFQIFVSGTGWTDVSRFCLWPLRRCSGVQGRAGSYWSYLIHPWSEKLQAGMGGPVIPGHGSSMAEWPALAKTNCPTYVPCVTAACEVQRDQTRQGVVKLLGAPFCDINRMTNGAGSCLPGYGRFG